MIGVVVGCGQWGKNHLRILKSLNIEVKGCDVIESEACKKFEVKQFIGEYKYYPEEHDFVVVATPPSSHFPIALKALLIGKHVLIEKPYVMEEEECITLNKLAVEIQKIIHVDLTFLYDSGFKKLLELRDKFGPVTYINSKRLGGRIQADINVVWDLAVHDLYMANELMFPFTIESWEKIKLGSNSSKVSLQYTNGGKVDILVSWDHPVRSRSFIIGGEFGIIEYNIDIPEKIKTNLVGVEVEKKEALESLYIDFFDRIKNNKYSVNLNKYSNLMGILLELK